MSLTSQGCINFQLLELDQNKKLCVQILCCSQTFRTKLWVPPWGFVAQGFTSGLVCSFLCSVQNSSSAVRAGRVAETSHNTLIRSNLYWE